MSAVEKYRPGDFCWAELATSDLNAAKEFYGGLFGWTANDMPVGPSGTYTLLMHGGREAAAAYPLDAHQRERGVPPHWILYIATDNADETADKIKEAGGTVVMEPFDVMTVGRMLVAQDPGGAQFCVWQARDHIGARVRNEDNTFCWPELASRDADRARAFYTIVFGYETKVSDMEHGVQYTEWQIGNESIGGMLQMTAEWGETPPYWAPYFMAADCDAAAAKAGQLGGAVVHGPTDIPHVGRFALIRDPQGATFYIIRLSASV